MEEARLDVIRELLEDEQLRGLMCTVHSQAEAARLLTVAAATRDLNLTLSDVSDRLEGLLSIVTVQLQDADLLRFQDPDQPRPPHTICPHCATETTTVFKSCGCGDP
jgi:hypothetical protein